VRQPHVGVEARAVEVVLEHEAQPLWSIVHRPIIVPDGDTAIAGPLLGSRCLIVDDQRIELRG